MSPRTQPDPQRRCRCRRLLAGLLAALSSSLGALEYALPSRPQDSYADLVGDQAVVWVEWGAVGDAQLRDPQLIQEQGEALRAFLRSPEMRASCLALIRQGQEREVALVRARLAAAAERYASVEQATALPRQCRLTSDVLALPEWAEGVPLPVRDAIQVLLFDDRDAAQRAWALAQVREGGRMSFAYCSGWRSGEDRDRFWRAHPGLIVHPIATDQFAACYGVTAYPARIRFGADTLTIDQGLDQ